MSDYPLQFEKVQAPPLRDETLARSRLLDWLNVKIHRRAVLILAEAGYGKTTLLADFTRRTRVRVSWYRLDRGDRDWLGFIAHLVASFRTHQPDFGPVTRSMIRDASMGTSSRSMVLEAFIRELSTLPPEPAALVLDDFHLVDDSEDARAIVRAMLTRAPERLSFVLISRTMPSLPLARLRGQGEVVELHTSELRFAPEETEQLFRETYALELEPGIVAELSRRTEGWVASLQLVRAAIRDRNKTEIRAFVRSLSGAEGNLYDYLAEEVVGELPGDLQQFLMRTSLLEVIEPHLGSVAADVGSGQTRSSIGDGEALGLFSRIGPNARDQVRAHPLVRDFLHARLRRTIGGEAVIGIHRSIAAAAESRDWRIAGHHYLEAGDLEDARRVLGTAIEAILATGAYAAAEELVTSLPSTDRPDPNVLVVLSRLAQQRGQSQLSRDLAESAFSEARSTPVALTVLSARLVTGDIEGAVSIAADLESHVEAVDGASIGRAMRLMLETSLAGDIALAVTATEEAIASLRTSGAFHYVGVGLSNIGYLRKAQGDAAGAHSAADEAVELLGATSAGGELVSAHLVRAWALAHVGDLATARSAIREAAATARGDQAVEVAYEGAEVEALYGDPLAALSLLDGVWSTVIEHSDIGEQVLLSRIHTLIALGRFAEANEAARHLDLGAWRSSVAFDARRRLVLGLIEILMGGPDAEVLARASQEGAEAQGADLWASIARIAAASLKGEEFAQTARKEAMHSITGLTLAADVVAGHLDWLDGQTHQLVAEEARRRAERWRPPLRRVVEHHSGPAQAQAAALLDEIGEQGDVVLLRRMARIEKGGVFPSSAGRGLARRLAPQVFVEDLGRVVITIGGRKIDGTTVRRKVLALLCFLLTKPRFTAAREEVLEAMWPDLGPSTSQNSLNQTVYFLRRVFEPRFSEDTSPGYVGQDGETVWLDWELVQSLSRRCRDLMGSVPSQPDASAVAALAKSYHSRFAIDFLYEDWASQYRDSLHAAFLRVVESSVRFDTDSGHYERGIDLAQMAIEADPDAEELQMALARLYRLTGSLAAASEQYQIYARSQRDLGLDPEPFESI